MLPLPRRTRPLVDAFLQSKWDAGRSPRTLENYAYILRQLAQAHRYLPRNPSVLERFLRANAGRSDVTHASRFDQVRVFYRWLLKRGYVGGPANPYELDRMERPRVRQKLPRVLSILQLRQVVRASRPPNERALILTLIDAGPRIGELAGRDKDDLVGNTLHVDGKEGQRLLPLTPAVAAYLRDLPSHSLFPKMGIRLTKGVVDEPANVRTLQRRVRRVMVRSGLTGPKLGPHTLRHSFATHFLRSSRDLYALARLLGHTTVRMSEKYVLLDIDDIADAHKRHSPMLSVAGLRPLTRARHLPTVNLSHHFARTPDEIDGIRVGVMLVEDRRPGKTWYYLRARWGRRRWQIASLGSELPLDFVDSLRHSIAVENTRRKAM